MMIRRQRSEEREEGRGNYEEEKRRTSWWIDQCLAPPMPEPPLVFQRNPAENLRRGTFKLCRY